jgi:N6-adenosine-specific RNA methylase IME4
MTTSLDFRAWGANPVFDGVCTGSASGARRRAGIPQRDVIDAPRGRHSEKPDFVFDMIERQFPHLPKIELNRRGAPRPGWAAWGNEVEAA